MERFNRHKFRELALYVAEQSTSDPKFGATKLNKILFFSDFLAFAHFGRAITGAAYQRLEKGPAPTVLLPVRKQMVDEGIARIESRNYFNQRQDRLVAVRMPDLSAFSLEEVGLVDEVIKQLRHHGAVSVSDLSHEVSMAWQVAKNGEEIPYETVFVSVAAPTPSDIARGQELAAEHGW